jgi:hypothetical protein
MSRCWCGRTVPARYATCSKHRTVRGLWVRPPEDLTTEQIDALLNKLDAQRRLDRKRRLDEAGD